MRKRQRKGMEGGRVGEDHMAGPLLSLVSDRLQLGPRHRKICPVSSMARTSKLVPSQPKGSIL